MNLHENIEELLPPKGSLGTKEEQEEPIHFSEKDREYLGKILQDYHNKISQAFFTVQREWREAVLDRWNHASSTIYKLERTIASLAVKIDALTKAGTPKEEEKEYVLMVKKPRKK